MALTFRTKIKTDLLNSWGASKKIYVGLYCQSASYEVYTKASDANFTLDATPASDGKITYSTPINITVGDDTSVAFIGIFDSAAPHSISITTNTGITNLLAYETLSTAETFTYGGTFRINQIVIELA